MIPKYKYYLQVNDGELTEAFPVIKADTSLDYTRESSQRFFRKSLSSKIDFVRDDYDLIMSAGYEDTIYFYLHISTDNGLTWAQYWQSKFVRTSCTINRDDKRVSVTPETVDEYVEILKGIEKEYNLIELAPATDRLQITKRPCIQTYVPGDSVVNCFVSGCSWEVDAESTTDLNTIRNTYKFSLNTILKEIEVTTQNGDTTAVGTYAGRIIMTSETEWTGRLAQQNGGTHYIDVTCENLSWSVAAEFSSISASLCNSSGTVLYRYTALNRSFDSGTVTFSAVSGTGTMNGELYTYNVFARLLCDVSSISGSATSNIPAQDITDENLNYRKVIGYAVPIATISNQYSTEPTEYGRRDDGTYFAPPFSVTGDKFFPIAQSTWRYASLWFRHSYVDAEVDKEGRKSYILRDAYELSSCISVLLKEIAPGITHEATTAYSEFLYSQTNPVSGQPLRLYLTQKTNILKGEYSQPAMKAPTTLQEILSMLRNALGCYWFIENGKLRIEHISWFKNGGSYSNDIRTVGYDLTQIRDVRNGQLWEYGQREYTYDKQDLSERYEYSWMDETTQGFDGYPIEIRSANVEDGKVEEVNIGGFTTDIDYMLLNPGDISNDGFALMCVTNVNALARDDSDNYYPGFYGSTGTRGQNNSYSTPLYPLIEGYEGATATLTFECAGGGQANLHAFDSNGEPISPLLASVQEGSTTATFTIPEGAVSMGFVMLSGTLNFNLFSLAVSGQYGIPFTKVTAGGVEYVMQNGYLAMVNLQPNYLISDMPNRNITVNETEMQAKGIMRKMKQTLTFPSDAVDVDANKLVKTLVGFGEYTNISLNLFSRIIKATLNYDTDSQ